MLDLYSQQRSGFTLVIWFSDEERIGQKRKKKISHFNNFFSDGGSGGGTGGTGGTGGGGPGFFRGT